MAASTLPPIASAPVLSIVGVLLLALGRSDSPLGQQAQSAPQAEPSAETALAECWSVAAAARNEPDSERRRALYEQALAAYAKLLAEPESSVRRAAAEAFSIETSVRFARALAEDAAAEGTPEPERLRARRAEVLGAAFSRARAALEALRTLPVAAPDPERERALGELMLLRGELLAEMARDRSGAESAALFERASQAWADVISEFGAETPFALRARQSLGGLQASRGMWQAAADSFRAVIDAVIPLDHDRAQEILASCGPDEKELRWLFVELATEGLVQVASELGDSPTACRYGLHLYDLQAREEFHCSVHGSRALFAVARAVHAAGGWIGGDLSAGRASWFPTREDAAREVPAGPFASASTVALRIASSLVTSARDAELQARARELLAELLREQDVVASPEVAFEAAEGELQSGDYASAIETYARVVRELEGSDEPERRRFGARAQYQIGNCFRLLDRPLEAAMAFREGCTSWRSDSEFDAKNAQGFYEMVRSLQRRESVPTQEVAELLAAAEALVAELGAPARDQILWSRALALEDAEQYERAIEEYRRIDASSDAYERALVGIGCCELRLGRQEAAQRIFEDYLEVYVQDPAKAPATPAHAARRREAVALAEFYRGYLAFGRASESDDHIQYAQAIEYLQRFTEDHPDQTKLLPQASYYLVLSQLASGDLEAARTTLARMVADHGESSFTGTASIALYKRVAERREAASDPEDRQRLLREMAEDLSRANALAAAPSFANLRMESSHWKELGEWAEAERSLREILDAYGSVPERRTEMHSFVLPDLGKALLLRRRAAEAKAILDPLVRDGSEAPSKSTVLDHALAITGWLEVGAAGEIEVVPGAGGTDEEFADLTLRLNTLLAGIEERYGCEWFAVQFTSLYARYVRGERDPRARDECREILAVLETVLGEKDWKSVEETCSSPRTPEELRRSSGHRALQRRFLWLRSMLP